VSIFVGTLVAAVVDENHAVEKAPQAVCEKVPSSFAKPGVPVFVPGDSLAVPRPPGTSWNAEGNVTFKGTLVVALGQGVPASEFELSLDHNDVYELRWIRRGREVGEPADVGPSVAEGGGLSVYRVITGAAEVDTVVITARSGDGLYSIGHVLPVEP
jgi:hypothetical protein